LLVKMYSMGIIYGINMEGLRYIMVEIWTVNENLQPAEKHTLVSLFSNGETKTKKPLLTEHRLPC
jgi:hypothetical protein